MINTPGGRVKTVDHDEIIDWVEEHGGHPARLEGRSMNKDSLRIDFEGERPDESTERIPWEDFFSIFEEECLVFAYEQYPPELEEVKPNHQKFELKEEDPGMRSETATEMESPDIRDNMKETSDND